MIVSEYFGLVILAVIIAALLLFSASIKDNDDEHK